MFTTRKWWLLLVAALLPLSANADGLLQNRFLAAGAGTPINNIGTAIGFHKITWNVSGTASVCTVALDTSADGITWSAGGAIAGQTCTSNGTSTVATVVANYVRMNMTALTLTAGSSVSVTWTGYVNNPGGGGSGSIVSCTTTGGVAYENGTNNTLTCGSQFTWATSPESLQIGTGPIIAMGPTTAFGTVPGIAFLTAALAPAAELQIGDAPSGTAIELSVATGRSIELAAGTSPGAALTFSSTVGGDLLRGTQVGDFTLAQPNDYFESILTGSNANCDMSHLVPSPFILTNAITGIVCTPSGATGVTNAYSTAVIGLAQENNSGALGQFGFSGAVGGDFGGFCNANNAHCWSINAGATDAVGSTNQQVIGMENDITVSSATTTSGFGFLASMRGNGQASTMPAYDVQIPAGTGSFTSGFKCDNGAFTQAALDCLDIGQATAGTTQINSQVMYFRAHDNGAALTQLFQLNKGDIYFSGGFPQAQLNSSGKESWGVALTSSSNGIVTNGLVKVNTGATDAVVPCTTTDTICAGFVQNSEASGQLLCNSGATTCPIAGSPGSLVKGIVGTGTCAIGNFVVIDTTTNGRVKCQTTQPSNTELIGIAMSVQGSVGSTVDILTVFSPPVPPLVTTTTATNCAANGTAANPSVVSCSAASAGMFSCATAASTGTCQVNTTAVTANSEILIIQDAADGGAGQLNVTCNTGNDLAASAPFLASKSAGASFTINLGTVTTNPACFEYHIVN